MFLFQEDGVLYPQRVNRQKRVLDINFQFNADQGGRGGPGGGRGERRGGRGDRRGDRGGERRGDRADRGDGPPRGGRVRIALIFSDFEPALMTKIGTNDPNNDYLLDSI